MNGVGVTKLLTARQLPSAAKAKASMTMSSETVGLIPLGGIAQLIHKQGKWVLVEIYDPIIGYSARGWARKKYFERLPLLR